MSSALDSEAMALERRSSETKCGGIELPGNDAHWRSQGLNRVAKAEWHWKGVALTRGDRRRKGEA